MDLASAEAEIRHVFGDTPITEASIGAAPPDILVKLSGFKGGGEWVVITDLKNMVDYSALQYFVFLQKDLATVSQPTKGGHF